jgi:hypothetical protein
LRIKAGGNLNAGRLCHPPLKAEGVGRGLQKLPAFPIMCAVDSLSR